MNTGDEGLSRTKGAGRHVEMLERYQTIVDHPGQSHVVFSVPGELDNHEGYADPGHEGPDWMREHIG